MVTPVIAPNNIPEFGWLPRKWLNWWLTPRATERTERFRERALRLSAFILLVSVLIYTPLGIISTFDTITGRTIERLGIVVVAYVFLAVAMLLIHKKYTIPAAWLLIAIWIGTFFSSAHNNGLWMGLSIVFLGFTIVYGQLILPGRQNVYLMIINILVILALLFFPAPAINVDSGQMTLPVSVVIAVVFVVIMNALLLVLRQELQSRLVELSSFVSVLDARVQERTRELEIARKQAEDANTIKSKFLANMSHELRTPLNAILNFTAFVADGVMGDVNEEQEDALRQSISSGKHLLSLINDILDVTKIEAGLMDLFIQAVDLNEILAGVVGIGKGLAKDKPIDLIVDIQEKLPVTYGDKRRMRQVFLNMVSNAFKFTPKGSITIHAHATDTHLHVHVTDTGIGISPEHQKLVFESFKQAQNDTLDTVGTGLGMPISKYFVESHRGRMWFETEVGKGTTFFVELPILTEAEANSLDVLSL
ncbi:MAG: ATP-binding protein [bacterium]|nr:ATP-binding protein [bacterium]